MFVDPDDYVTPDFCETPYQAALREGADLIIFQWAVNDVLDSVIIKKDAGDSEVVNIETVLRYGGVFVWNKLYRRELFDAIRYPEGRVYEDVATTHKLIFAAKRILMLPDILYYYVSRKDSISHTRSVKIQQDAFLSELERAEFLKTRGYAADIYLTRVWSCALTLLALEEPCDDPLFQHAEVVADSIPGISPRLGRIKKLMLLVWKLDKCLFHLICRILGKKDKNT